VDTLKVRDAKDVEAAVRAAIAGDQPLEIIGHGSKRLIGQPTATNANGVIDNALTFRAWDQYYNPTTGSASAGEELAGASSTETARSRPFT